MSARGRKMGILTENGGFIHELTRIFTNLFDRINRINKIFATDRTDEHRKKRSDTPQTLEAKERKKRKRHLALEANFGDFVW